MDEEKRHKIGDRINDAKEEVEAIMWGLQEELGDNPEVTMTLRGFLFMLDPSEYKESLEKEPIDEKLREAFEDEGYELEESAEVQGDDTRWAIVEDGEISYTIREDKDKLKVFDGERGGKIPKCRENIRIALDHLGMAGIQLINDNVE